MQLSETQHYPLEVLAVRTAPAYNSRPILHLEDTQLAASTGTSL